ncbi:hypothetical protein [Paraglaciecola sp.]|uniref:hypothetical protein n=1 Tax=Paraglaciecola sp. TaxID=1920173 RepID=UPI003EF59114
MMYSDSKIYKALVKVTAQENRISKEKAEQSWSNFLTCINAPSDLAGLYLVNDLLRDFSGFSGLIERLSKALNVTPAMLDALKFSVDLAKCDERTYTRIQVGKGWLSKRALYSLLFSYRSLQDGNTSRWFLLRFVEQFIATQNLLKDPAFQPVTKSREEEVCRAFRLLCIRDNRDFNVDTLPIGNMTMEDCDLTVALESMAKLLMPGDSNRQYVMTLLHFFNGDWKTPIPRATPVRRDPRSGRRYGRKIRQEPLPGELSDLHSIQPFKAPNIDVEGINGEDFFIAQQHVIFNSNSDFERKTTNLYAVNAVRDKTLKRARQVDISARVRKSQNTSMTNLSLMSPTSLNSLVVLIIKLAKRSKDVDYVISLFCSFTLGKSLNDLADLSVFFNDKKLEQGIYLNRKKRQGYWYFKIENNTQIRRDTKDNLNEVQEWAKTPCPSFLVNLLLKRNEVNKKTKLFQMSSSELIKNLKGKLKRHSERHFQQSLSLTQIQSFTMRYVESKDQIDPVIFDFSYNNHYYSCRVSRSYVCISNQTRLRQLDGFWHDISLYTGQPTLKHFFFDGAVPDLVESSAAVGSKYCITDQVHQGLTKHLVEQLSRHKLSVTKPLSEVIAYHNHFAFYTTWLLAFSVGYRAVINPLPTLALHFSDLGLLTISDKDDSDYTHTRVVACPFVLNKQLEYYRQHLLRLSELLRTLVPGLCHSVDEIVRYEQKLLSLSPLDSANWFRMVRNDKRRLGPLFWLDDNLNVKPISPSLMVGNLPAKLKIPANVGRHWLKSMLLSEGVSPELINWQMGHWQSGQSPLGNYSCLNPKEASNELNILIEKHLSDIGWTPCTSALL